MSTSIPVPSSSVNQTLVSAFLEHVPDGVYFKDGDSRFWGAILDRVLRRPLVSAGDHGVVPDVPQFGNQQRAADLKNVRIGDVVGSRDHREQGLVAVERLRGREIPDRDGCHRIPVAEHRSLPSMLRALCPTASW